MDTSDTIKPENYRLITLLSWKGKVFTFILRTQVENFADKVSLIKNTYIQCFCMCSSKNNVCIINFKQSLDNILGVGAKLQTFEK
jgi:hypothetical protein